MEKKNTIVRVIRNCNMISLRRIVEQQDVSGQYYDFGKDFALFRRSIDGSFEQIKEKFEQSIGSKLIGKRVRARASRGYKQYVKDYEFDVTKITIDDYYDNYVVVAYDNATPNPKEYFLKPGFKVTILGPATGQPSPQKGGKSRPEETPKAEDGQPSANLPQSQSQKMQLALPGKPVKEDAMAGDFVDRYSGETIVHEDIPWLKQLLKKPDTIDDFIPRTDGWMKRDKHGRKVAVFGLKIPTGELKTRINPTIIKYILDNRSKNGSSYELKKMDYDRMSGEWSIQIKKTIANPNL